MLILIHDHRLLLVSCSPQSISYSYSSFTDCYFLINWQDEDGTLHDIVPSKLVVPPEDLTILDVNPGMVCRVSHNGQFYPAKIIERG